MKRQWQLTLLTVICVAFLGGCGKKEKEPEKKEPEKTMSDKAAQGIINYVNTPQDKARDANQMILDADKQRLKALDEK